MGNFKIDRSRERLIQSIVFFARKAAPCPKLKLMKLLWLADWNHFKQTGQTITGLEYYAYPKGPMPTALDAEFSDPSPDFVERIEIQAEMNGGSRPWEMAKPLDGQEFDDSHFTPAQLRILEQVAAEYGSMTGERLAEITHAEDMPWHLVWHVKGSRQKIELVDMINKANLPTQLINFLAEADPSFEGLAHAG